MKLHKVKKRTAEPQNIEYRMSKGGIASLDLFIKQIEYIIRCWTLDVRCSLVFNLIGLDARGQRGRSYAHAFIHEQV